MLHFKGMIAPSKIRAAISQELAKQGDGATLRTLRRAAEVNLGLEAGALDAHKDLVRDCAEELFNVVASSGAGNDQPATKKPKKGASPYSSAPDAGQGSPDSAELSALKAMARAVAAGPRVWMGLKEASDEEQCDMLRERLRDKGAAFKGCAPSKKDIAVAKAATEQRRDLEDIDPSLIISDGRRRARRGDPEPPRAAAAPTAADDGCDSESTFDC